MGIEPIFLLYESNVLPLNYFGISHNHKRPSLALLLKTRFFLPFPLLRPASIIRYISGF